LETINKKVAPRLSNLKYC